MTTAIDDSYEALCLDWRPTRIWDTTWRAWRWVLLAPWRIGQPPVPSNPDTLLDEAAPYFAAKLHPGGRPSETKSRILATLNQDGPQTTNQLALRLNLPRNTVKNCLGNHLTAFERAGRDSRGQMQYKAREAT